LLREKKTVEVNPAKQVTAAALTWKGTRDELKKQQEHETY